MMAKESNGPQNFPKDALDLNVTKGKLQLIKSYVFRSSHDVVTCDDCNKRTNFRQAKFILFVL